MAKRESTGDAAIRRVRTLASTPGPIGPLVVGVGVTGWLVAMHLIAWVPWAFDRSNAALQPLPVDQVVVDILIGGVVFLAFWLVAPIAGELDLRHVLTRSVLVVGIAATVSWIVGVVVAIGRGILACIAPALVGNAEASCAPFGWWVAESLPATFGFELLHAVGFAVLIAPAVLLGGILLWMRRRERPLDAQVAGIIDV